MRTPSIRFRRVAGKRGIRKRIVGLVPAVTMGSLLLGAGLGACQQREVQARGDAGDAATIRVVSGTGRLSGGEEHVIAQWRHGRAEDGSFVQFRGQDGGPVLDLVVSGLPGGGDFACGPEGAGLELRVDVNNRYQAVPDAPCRVEVLRAEDGMMEGRYTAMLRHSGNPRDEMIVAGTFRASAPRAEGGPVQAAKAPRLGVLRK